MNPLIQTWLTGAGIGEAVALFVAGLLVMLGERTVARRALQCAALAPAWPLAVIGVFAWGWVTIVQDLQLQTQRRRNARLASERAEEARIDAALRKAGLDL